MHICSLSLVYLIFYPGPFSPSREGPECSKAHRLNCLPETHQCYFWLLLVSWISQDLWGFFFYAFANASFQMGLFPIRIICKSWRLNMGFIPTEQASQTASFFPMLLATLDRCLCNMPLYLWAFISIPGLTTELKSYLFICFCTKL